MPNLLGAWSGKKDTGRNFIDGEAATWRPDMEAEKATFDFGEKTGRFDTEGPTG